MRVNEILLVESDDRCVLTSRKRLDDAGKTADKRERLRFFGGNLILYTKLYSCTYKYVKRTVNLSSPAIAQLVERSTVDRLVGCSIHPRWRSKKRRGIFYVVSIKGTFGVVVTFLPSKEEPRFRLPEGAYFQILSLASA